MAAAVLPFHHLSVRLPSASISPPTRLRHAPLNLPSSVTRQLSTSLHRFIHTRAKSRSTFPLIYALASLSLEERNSEEEELDEDAELDLQEEDFKEDSEDSEEEEEEEEEKEEEEEPGPLLSSGQQDQASSSPSLQFPVLPPPPVLSTKEKKELRSYALSLGKKLKTQQIGKNGVTPSVAISFVQNLESNELLKIKVLGSCPSEFEDAARELERVTGSVAISQIGHTVILYRPSLKKVKNETTQGARKEWKPRPRGPRAAVQGQTGQRSQSSNRSRRTWGSSQPSDRSRRTGRPSDRSQQTGRRSQPSDRSRQTGRQSRPSDRSRHSDRSSRRR